VAWASELPLKLAVMSNLGGESGSKGIVCMWVEVDSDRASSRSSE